MLCLLGPPAVRLGDVPRPLKLRPKAVALLARIVLEGPTSRAELADLIFGETEDPRAMLRWHLTYLRAQLSESLRKYLLVTADRIAFDAPTDVESFQHGARRLLERPMIRPPRTCSACTEATYVRA